MKSCGAALALQYVQFKKGKEMARVTVEYCIGEGKTDNRFELVVLAVQHARDLKSGMYPVVNPEKHKPPVLALQSIERMNVRMDVLRHRFLCELHNVNYADNEKLSECDSEFEDDDVFGGQDGSSFFIDADDGDLSFFDEEEDLDDAAEFDDPDEEKR